MTKWDFRMMGDRSARVYLYEEIGEFWGKSARDFADELTALGELDEIHLHINSMGGSVFDGFAMHKTLVDHPATVMVHVDGVAASIASVIMLAGDEISISENGFVMVHEPMTFAAGTARDLRRDADMLDKLQTQAVAIYTARTGMSDAEVIQMIDGTETWLSATEAVEKGFADNVAPVNKAVALAVDRQLWPNAPAAIGHRAMDGKAGEHVAKVASENKGRAVAARLRVIEIDGHTAAA